MRQVNQTRERPSYSLVATWVDLSWKMATAECVVNGFRRANLIAHSQNLALESSQGSSPFLDLSSLVENLSINEIQAHANNPNTLVDDPSAEVEDMAFLTYYGEDFDGFNE
jgi:hypothetical protein